MFTVSKLHQYLPSLSNRWISFCSRYSKSNSQASKLKVDVRNKNGHTKDPCSLASHFQSRLGAASVKEYQSRVSMLWCIPWDTLQKSSNLEFSDSCTSGSCIFVFNSLCHLVSFWSSVTFCMHIVMRQWIYQHSAWKKKKIWFCLFWPV